MAQGGGVGEGTTLGECGDHATHGHIHDKLHAAALPHWSEEKLGLPHHPCAQSERRSEPARRHTQEFRGE